jgi:PEP-CTERM motif
MMIFKTLALSASALVVSVLAVPAQAAINAPVPTANYIVFGGDDWAWASPCPPSGGFGNIMCGTGDTVDFSYQATQGWRLATAADLATGPTVADFGTAGNFACAAAWFTRSYDYCDYGDAAAGAVHNSPGGNVWYAETWVIRDGGVPEPASWAMMIAGFGLVGATMRRRRTAVLA